MCERLYNAAHAVASMSFESAITIILTALGVMLAVVTIGIAGLAIWGYLGIRDSVKDMATKRVDEAVQAALQKYPEAERMLKAVKRLEEQAELWDQARNQVLTGSEPLVVERASKPVVQEGGAETPLESVQQQITPIADYPGEVEKGDASASGQSGGDANSRSNNSQTSNPSSS